MAAPTINFAGFVYDDAGDAVNGATVHLYAKNGTTTTVESSSITTNSSGYWSYSHATPGEFDVEIVSGASKRRIKFDDKIHLSEVDAEKISIRGNEGALAGLYLYADEGDDVSDQWLMDAGTNGVLAFGNDAASQGSFVDHLSITPNSTIASSIVTIPGILDVNGSVDWDVTDVQVDSSGDIDLVSTNNTAGAIYLHENAGTSGTITVHADQGTSATEGAASIQLLSDAGGINVKSKLNGANAILLTADGGTSETIVLHADQGTGTGSIELLSDAGGIELDAGTDIILDAGGADIFLKDDGTLFGTLTNNSGELLIKSSSSGTTAATFSGANVTFAGTVDATTDFTIGSTVITDDSIVMTPSTSDTITIAGSTNGALAITTVDNAAAAANVTVTADGAITLDAAGDITLDADGADVIFKDGGTTIATLTNSSSDFVITTGVQDKDFIIKGDDGGGAITALTLDMSAAGAAVFNNTVTATGFTIGSAAILEAELEILDGASVTTTELNLLDGGTSVGSSITLADSDGIIVNDGGTMKTIPASDIKTYSGGAVTALNNATANELVTVGSTTTELDAETSLTFDGNNMFIASGGGIVVGATAQVSISTDGSTDLTPEIQGLGTATADASMLLAAFSTTATIAAAPVIGLAKSANASIGSSTAVANDEILGAIIAYGADGTDLESIAAKIHFEADDPDDAITGNRMPGAMVFSTTKDAASQVAPLEVMRITNNGSVIINDVAVDADGADIPNNLLRAAGDDGGRSPGLIFSFDYVQDAASGGVMWRTAGSNPTKAKGIIDVQVTAGGSNMFFGTSNSYSTGITNYPYINTAGAFVNSSDSSLKTSVATISNATATVRAMRGVSFNWVSGGRADAGFIAQEVEAITALAHTVETNSITGSAKKYLNYNSLMPYLAAAIKEIDARVTALE